MHQRSVDELRGACLRSGAAEALLVTTSGFSEVVRRSAAARDPAAAPVAPVHLIDGQELLGLLIRHRLGVREQAQGLVRRLGIDEAFFDSLLEGLTDSAEATARRDVAAQGKATPVPRERLRERSGPPKSAAAPENTVIPRWRVTVHVSSVSGPAPKGDELPGTGSAGTGTTGIGPAEGGR